MKVRIVTDSTSDIPQHVADELGVRIVPVYIRFGDKTYRDGVDIRTDEFYSMLDSNPIHPATSQPNPEDFTSVYREGGDETEGIVSIHISSRISGTYNSAKIARNSLKSPFPIEVIDSRFNSAGLGLVVIAAARLARSGAGFNEVIEEAYRAVAQVGMFGMFETMKYLARSGRVSKAIAAVANYLHVMPLLTFHDGEIVRAGLVRTVARGMERIYEYVRRQAPLQELTIVHSVAEERAQQLKQRLTEFLPAERIEIAGLGAGLGVHGGPGVLLAAVRRR